MNIELEPRFLDILYELKTTTSKEISHKMETNISYVNTIASKLAENDEIVRMRKPDKKHKYKFFDDLFPKRGFLIVDLTALDDLTEELIDRVPEQITPRILKDFRAQVEWLKNNGLPDENYKRIRAYVDSQHLEPDLTLEELEAIENGVPLKTPSQSKKGKPGYHSVKIGGVEIQFVPPKPNVWVIESSRAIKGSIYRTVNFNSLREDDGIQRLYDAMAKAGYNMTPFDEFSEKLSSELRKYD
jgi:hypothetical protein